MLAAVACGHSYSSSDNPIAPPAADAGGDSSVIGLTDGGTCACTASQQCVNGACVPGCVDGIVYVSADGDDTNSGCDKTKPKKTIGGAYAFLQTLNAVGQEVHVCRGTYAENVSLTYPASLRGGYECALWTRTANLKDHVNETILAPSSGIALDVSGTKIDGSITIDGLSIHGADAPSGNAIAFQLDSGAAPKISYVDVTGGAATNATTYGLFSNGATPTIDQSTFTGGTSTCTTVCPAAPITLAAAFASTTNGSITNSVFTGGTLNAALAGPSTTALTLEGTFSTFTNNTIVYGSGTAFSGYASIGLLIPTTATVSIADTTVFPGAKKLTCTGTDACATVGIQQHGGTMKVTRTRVADANATTSHALSEVGILAEANAAVDASFVALSIPNNPAEVSAFAFRATTQATMTIDGSTAVAPALFVVNGGNITVRDTLWVHAPNDTIATRAAMLLDDCNATSKVAVHNVGFVDPRSFIELHQMTTSCAVAPGATSLADANALLEGRIAGSTSGNIQIANTCAANDTTCAVSASPAAAVIAAWSTNVDALVQGGFKLLPNAPCIVTNGGASDLATRSPNDGFNAPRTGPEFSIGAHQLPRTDCP